MRQNQRLTQPATENLTPSAERSTALESGCATFRGGAAHRELEKAKNQKSLQNTSKKLTTKYPQLDNAKL